MLKVENLKVHYPIRGGFFNTIKDHVYAVDGVDLEIEAGKTYGLIGESGSGKTTVGKVVLGLEKATDTFADFSNSENSSENKLLTEFNISELKQLNEVLKNLDDSKITDSRLKTRFLAMKDDFIQEEHKLEEEQRSNRSRLALLKKSKTARKQ